MSDGRAPVFTRHPISATPQYGMVLQPSDKLEQTDVYDSTTGQWSACPCPGLTVQEGVATIWIRPLPAPDPRDPRPDSEMVAMPSSAITIARAAEMASAPACEAIREM